MLSGYENLVYDSYRRSIEPLVGADVELKRALLGKLEEVLWAENLRVNHVPDEIRWENIDFNSLNCDKGLKSRIRNALANEGIETYGDLLRNSERDLKTMKNVGERALDILAQHLKEKGLGFYAKGRVKP